MSRDSLANLLGAFALGLTDAMVDAGGRVTGRGPSASAALVTLAMFEGLSVERLRRHVALSQSATVRLVDRLEEDGLVERTSAGRGRLLSLRLSERGRAVVGDILGGRERTVEGVLAHLGSRERARLRPLLEAMLAALTRDRDSAHRICRLCDHRVCEGSGCPVDLAVGES